MSRNNPREREPLVFVMEGRRDHIFAHFSSPFTSPGTRDFESVESTLGAFTLTIPAVATWTRLRTGLLALLPVVFDVTT